MNEKFKFKFKIEYVIVIILVIAVVYLAAKSFIGGDNTTASADTASAYADMLEGKLEKTLSKVDGAGKVSVVITVNEGITSVYATEKKTVTSGTQTTVTETLLLVSGKPVVIREDYPEITGVVIVSKGADNLLVKVNLLNAAMTVLGVDSDKIEVLQG